MELLSVNVGQDRPVAYTNAPSGRTGIDKRPVDGPVRVDAPAPGGASGVAGDAVCDLRFHGGPDRAVYAFAREDLDSWEAELGRSFSPGSFGENLTTRGLDVNNALIGERWRIGDEVVLEVTGGRIPCRTFAGFVEEAGWVRRFNASAAGPGALLRVVVPGEIRAGDRVEVVHRPAHEITVARLHHAATADRSLLPETLVAAEWMESGLLELARTYAEKYGTKDGETDGATGAAEHGE
ncbi:MOSC domain-containing protein [Streptomyces sp. NPDC056069]|uniref:MOSC domain-containing protein n=1 Tax=Streptomyces sp. NPDC056069 TaxID=3345702 RepID=UPI0035DAC958